MSSSFTILAPAFYNDWDKVRYLKKSAERWNVPITFYGFGEGYKGWHYVQVDRLIVELEKVPTKNVIYTDASDAIVNGPMSRAAEVYVDTETEVLFSVEHDDQLCAGGWVGPKNLLLEELKYLRDFIPCKACGPDTMNPQVKWRCASLWFPKAIWPDLNREMFQVADEPLDIIDGKVYNPRTKQFPFLVHWAGGYTDPEVGKAALIEPTWKALNY